MNMFESAVYNSYSNDFLSFMLFSLFDEIKLKSSLVQCTALFLRGFFCISLNIFYLKEHTNNYSIYTSVSNIKD